MVYLSTIKYLIENKDLEKILKSIKFYLFDKIKKRNLKVTKKEIIINDCKMEILSNDEGISSELLIYGIHEPLTTHLIFDEVKSDMTVLDIGSNIGYYAVLESKLIGESGKIISIEPSPLNFKILEKNLKLQKIENFQTYNIAIGDKNEVIEFLVSKKSNWSKIKELNENPGENDEVIKVPLKTLDSFCKENNIMKIDLIRMDVEGYETNIISGAEETLKKFKPMLMIEVHKMYLGQKRTKEFLEKLNKFGYEIKYYYPRIFDTPIIADKKDIKKSSINELLKQLNVNKLPGAFQITLIPK